MLQESTLIDLSKKFAIKIVHVCNSIREKFGEKVLTNQLLRSGTSIGANIHEGNYASSKLDFINKFQVALKECYETEYWIDILHETGYLSIDIFENLRNENSKIRIKLTASIKTAKQNL